MENVVLIILSDYLRRVVLINLFMITRASYAMLKKEGLSHGITTIEENDKNNKKSSNEKGTQAYKLFSEGKSLIEVSVELGLREKEASRFFMEFLKLKRQYGLYQIYPQIEHYLPSFLKLHKVLKKNGVYVMFKLDPNFSSGHLLLSID